MALATRSLTANTATTNNASSLSVTPTGMVTADWLIFLVVSVGGAATHTNTAGSCTQVGSQLTQANTTTLSLWKKKAGASEAGPYTFAFAASLRAIVIVRAYSGGDTTDIIEDAPAIQGATAQQLDLTGVDPAATGGWHLLLEASNSAAGSSVAFSQPVSYTERHDLATTHVSNANACAGWAERVLPDASATGVQSFTVSGGVNRALAGGSVLLKPSGGAPPPPPSGPKLGLWRNKPTDGTVWRDRMDADEAIFGPFAGHWSQYKAAGAAGTLNAAEQTALDNGKNLHIYWKPPAASAPNNTWAAVASGARDSVLDAAATSIGSRSENIWLTIWHEPENDVGAAGSGMTATDYKAMWQRVRDRFDLAGVTNVTWCWVMQSSLSNPTQALTLWPGNSLVDITCFQQYISCGVTASLLGSRWLDTIQWLRDNDSPTRQWSDLYRPLAATEWGDAVNEPSPCTAAHRAGAIDSITAILSTLALKNVVEVRYFNARTDALLDKPSVDAVAFQNLKDATEAAGTGTSASAGLASGTGSAPQPTITIGSGVLSAPAGLASGVGLALDPTAAFTGGSVGASAGLASGIGQALDATTSAATQGGIAMGGGYPFLGYAGSLMQLPSPAPGYEPVDLVRGGTHELLAGGNVRDRIGCRRRFTLNWPAMSDANYALLRALTRLPGPYRYMDPLEVNLLTENQSIGTDELRTAEGFSAFTQGTVASSTAFARSWSRSLAWSTGTALAATGRGIRLFNDVAVIDTSWAAVRPNVTYTISGYLRASAAVSMQVGLNWYDTAGALISSPSGSGAPISTSNFSTRLSFTAVAPSNAAYGIGKFFNTTTTGSAITVYLDELQLEEGSTASSFRLGVGTPLVSVDSLGHTVPLADGTVGFAWHSVELQLIEL